MKYFRNRITQEVFGYDETYPNDEPLIIDAIKAGWEDISSSWPPSVEPSPPPTPEEKLAAAGLTVDELKTLLGVG